MCFRHQWQPIRGSLYQQYRPCTHLFGDVNQLYLVQLIDSASSSNPAAMANFKLKFHAMKVSLSCLSQDLSAVVKSSLFSQKHEFNLERSLRIVFSFKRRPLVGVFAHLAWIFSGNKASRSVPISKLFSPALTHCHTAVFCLTRFWLETCPQTRPDLWLNRDKGKLSDLKLFRHLEQQTQAVRGKKKTLSGRNSDVEWTFQTLQVCHSY